MESNRHFTAIVVGENPERIMKSYDSTIKVEPYVVYEFSKVKTYKENYIKCYRSLLNDLQFDDVFRSDYEEKLKHIETIDDIDFYTELTEDFDVDPETGNAMCDINPVGKYNWCRVGKELAMPLIDINNNEVFQARKCDVQWDKIHLAKQDIYKAAWEMVMNGRKPVTEEEKIIYENMKNRVDYFKFFGTEENYVINSTAFWGYAFVDQDGWQELEDNMNQIEWVGSFYERFIKNLPENALITVFECYRQ